MPRQLPRTVPGLALMAILGCATYHPLPLDRQAERRTLAPPDMRAVTVEAARIRHPLLQPVHLDLAQGLTPDQAAVVAVLTNPQLRAARDQRGLARAQVIQAGLLPNPVASYSQDIPTGGSDRGKVTGYDTRLGFDLTSLLTYSLRREAAGAQAQAVDLDIAWQEWQVAQAARMAAFHILALREELPLARSAEREAGRTVAAMASAVRTGAVSGVEEAAANSSWQQARDGLLLLEQEEGRQGRTLNALLGLPPGSPLSCGRTRASRTGPTCRPRNCWSKTWASGGSTSSRSRRATRARTTGCGSPSARSSRTSASISATPATRTTS